MSNEQEDLHVKFKTLKQLIKGWNSQQGDIKVKIESLERQIKEMDQLKQINASQYKCKRQKEKDLTESYKVRLPSVFSLGSLVKKRLTQEQRSIIEKHFSSAELFLALQEMGLNKSPGPDGITVEFIKKFWNLMFKDFNNMASKFHDTGILPKGLNSSFIALISKCKQPKLVSEFRPTSLINCSLKILLKTLANRLRNNIGGKLWHQALTDKYGDLSLMSNEPRTPMSPIMEGLVKLKNTMNSNTIHNLRFKWCLRDGNLIDFWNDHWHLIGVLSSRFDRLYQLANRKKISVKNIVAFWRSEGVNPWRRALRGWELDEYAELTALINNISMVEGQDIL
ncbi:hypothetical protein POM88_053011 [Heracleum sosnowskyi]|uniref:Reverse transcriptase n=1 Tax=Heracleum sosnowskyi TaxID=360622 RepID=A0AAD8GSA9_9APIA|nr:hypothetical protein POM88_053011 [Heracleum sosnowskyi]